MSLTIRLDVSRSTSGEIFVAAPESSHLLRICNFVAETSPPYTYNWISQGIVDPISPQQVDNLIVFYFQSGYSVLPIGEERDIRTLFAQFCVDPSPSPSVKAIIFGIAALAAHSQKHGEAGEWYRDLGEWCYGSAKDALSREDNDAQFEYLFASTLLVSLLLPVRITDLMFLF